MTDPDAPETTAANDDALDTYRYLRAGMVVMVGMLGIAVVIEWVNADFCWQTSISAYYYTAVHSVFVAALCAIGVQLIVYRGTNPTEDTLLNLAGILAFIVAFVPTDAPVTDCGQLGTVTKWGPAIENNVASIIAALVVAGAVLWTVYWITGERRNVTVGGSIALVVMWCILGVGVVGFRWHRVFFDKNAHNWAAILMFLAIVCTVCISAYFARRQTSPHAKLYFWAYVVIASAMVLTLLSVGIYRLTHPHWGHWVIVIEALLIGEFAAYWVFQTVELWKVKTRVELLPKHLQAAAVHVVDKPTPSGFATELRELRSCPPEQRVMRAL